jgi:hypothetical protein
MNSSHGNGLCWQLFTYTIGKNAKIYSDYSVMMQKLSCAYKYFLYKYRWTKSEIKCFVNGQLASSTEMAWLVSTNEVSKEM